MNSTSKGLILGSAERIFEMDEVLDRLEKRKPDRVIASDMLQYEDLKRTFVKQLIGGLVQSNFSLAEIEPFLHKAIAYLNETQWIEQPPPPDLQAALQDVGRLLTARAEKPDLKRRRRVAMEEVVT